MAPNDVFQVVGFTSDSILQGTQMQVTGLSIVALKKNQELWQQIGPLEPALQAGKATRTTVEVYSITPFLFGSTDAISATINALIGETSYLSVEFLNDEAMSLCNELKITLPPVLGKITRAELPPPPHLGIVCRGPLYKRAAAATT